jgi:hypothetical protein
VAVDRAQLIQRHDASSLLKPARNPPGIRLASGGHRRDHRRAKVLVEFVG